MAANNGHYSLMNYEIDLVNNLGKGAFGEVYLARNKTNKLNVAVKKIKYTYNNWTLAATELKALQKLNGHPNIVKLYDYHKDGSNLWIFMEFCELGDLEKYVLKNNPDFNRKLDLISQCANAISYMHSLDSPVIHRDIKPNNILVTKGRSGEIVVKVGDFGLAKLFQDVGQIHPHHTMLTVGGTQYYMAPEFFDSNVIKYYPPVDTFSLGLVFFVVVKYKGFGNFLPDAGAGPIGMSMTRDIQQGKQLKPLCIIKYTDDHKRAEVKNIINAMVQYRSSDRIKLSEVKRRLDNLKRPHEQPLVLPISPEPLVRQDSPAIRNINKVPVIKKRQEETPVLKRVQQFLGERLVKSPVKEKPKQPDVEITSPQQPPVIRKRREKVVRELEDEESFPVSRGETEDSSGDMRMCLQCQNYCVRTDNANPRAICAICGFEFCWDCTHAWVGAGKTCKKCHYADLRCQLVNCDMKYIDGEEVYCLRVCPNCKTLFCHETDDKHVECYKCNEQFCFVCLETSSDGEFECQGKTCNLAPIQL